MRNCAYNMREKEGIPREKFHASCPYRYLARLRCSYRSSRSRHADADAAKVSHCSFRSHHADADAAKVNRRFFCSHHTDADAAIVTRAR